MYNKYLKELETEGKLRNLKERSIATYKNFVIYFLNYTGENPEELICDDVRSFLLLKKEEGLMATTLNLYNSAIRFFYRNVLHILWDDIKYRTIFSTMYSSGLRVSEVLHLHYNDISRTHHQIHVRNTKSRQDRYTILPERNLQMLTEYWFTCGKPMYILFPSRFTKDYLSISSVEQVMRRSVRKAGLSSGITPHSLRHSFATHLMEAGVEYRNIQALLGHRDPKSTEVYLHVSNKSLMGIVSPFDKRERDNRD